MFRYIPKELIECQWNKMRQQKIEHVENKFQSGITSLNGEELERLNVTRAWYNKANKRKETLNTFGHEVKENSSSVSEKKEQSRDGYVSMYEFGKNSTDQHMSVHVQQQIYSSVRWKSFLQIKNRVLKTFKIVLWVLNNQKGALKIQKGALRILKIQL